MKSLTESTPYFIFTLIVIIPLNILIIWSGKWLLGSVLMLTQIPYLIGQFEKRWLDK